MLPYQNHCLVRSNFSFFGGLQPPQAPPVFGHTTAKTLHCGGGALWPALLKDVKSWPKIPSSAQNLISDKYYDLWLSIDTKNSPLSGILLLLQAAELRRSKMKIFKQKKVKISNFELQKRYIPQKKAKNIYNSDSARKSVNFCKKKFFFSIFLIFATCSRTP